MRYLAMPPNDNHNDFFGMATASLFLALYLRWGVCAACGVVRAEWPDSSLRFCKRSALLEAIHDATTDAHVGFQHARAHVNAHRITSLTHKHVRCAFWLPRSHRKLAYRVSSL